jgi:hypothetical protein
MVAFLAVEFKPGAEMRRLFETACPSTAVRKPKHEKKRLRIKGSSAAKPGPLLKSRISIRVYFARGGRKPGFFELDALARRGPRNPGRFCRALTVTGAGSGWTEVCPLLNRADFSPTPLG